MSGLWGHLWAFEKLVTMKVIRFIYIIGLIVGAIAGIIGIIKGIGMMNYNASMGLGSAMLSLIGMLVGLLFWRLLCEFWIVIFGIYDRLGDIRDNTAAKPAAGE